MAARWTEGADGAALSLTVDAIDADRREARELADFAGRARTPPEDEPGMGGTRPRDVVLLLVGAFVLGPLLADAVVSLAIASGYTPAPYLGVATFFVGALLPSTGAVALAHRRKREEERRPLEDTFTLSLDPTGFTVRGRASAPLRVPLSEIHAFEGGRRVVLVRASGARTALPCDLGAPDQHHEVAARFGDALARARARGGGYRGPGAGERGPADAEAPGDDPEAEDRAHGPGRTEII